MRIKSQHNNRYCAYHHSFKMLSLNRLGDLVTAKVGDRQVFSLKIIYED